MTRAEYLSRLRANLENYYGDIAEIMVNYETIIDEMLGEGLSMQEIIGRLGSPAVLAEEIATEFNLEYKKKVGLPLWAKIILIVLGVMIFGPLLGGLMGIFIGLIATIFGLMVGIIALVFSGLLMSLSIWFDPGLTLVFKLVFSVTSIAGTVSLAIIFYYACYGIIFFIKFVWKQLVILAKNIKVSLQN